MIRSTNCLTIGAKEELRTFELINESIAIEIKCHSCGVESVEDMDAGYAACMSATAEEDGNLISGPNLHEDSRSAEATRMAARAASSSSIINN